MPTVVTVDKVVAVAGVEAGNESVVSLVIAGVVVVIGQYYKGHFKSSKLSIIYLMYIFARTFNILSRKLFVPTFSSNLLYFMYD